MKVDFWGKYVWYSDSALKTTSSNTYLVKKNFFIKFDPYFPATVFSYNFACTPPQPNFEEEIFFNKIRVTRCSFQFWIRISYVFSSKVNMSFSWFFSIFSQINCDFILVKLSIYQELIEHSFPHIYKVLLLF